LTVFLIGLTESPPQLGLLDEHLAHVPAYQVFLTLWKDADPDIPILVAAKAEYSKLH
jgi:hypothetical protein